MSFVLDASCLIYLGKLKLLEKLKTIEGKKYIPRSVYEEVVIKGHEREESEVGYIEEQIKKQLIEIKDPNKIISDAMPIDKADKDVLSLAKEINAIPIIDDKEARNIAEFHNLDYHGSLYLLILLVNNKTITKKEALNYIDKMIDLGFHLSTETYKEIMKKM